MASIFASEEVISKGLLADFMFQSTPYRQEALNESFNWSAEAEHSYVREAGWHFKTLAVQEVGKNLVGVFFNFCSAACRLSYLFYEIFFMNCSRFVATKEE